LPRDDNDEYQNCRSDTLVVICFYSSLELLTDNFSPKTPKSRSEKNAKDTHTESCSWREIKGLRKDFHLVQARSMPCRCLHNFSSLSSFISVLSSQSVNADHMKIDFLRFLGCRLRARLQQSGSVWQTPCCALWCEELFHFTEATALRSIHHEDDGK
jgi:hypothetical protein